MGVGVVVPVKDKLDLTKSIVEQCHEDFAVTDVTVIDNGSTDGTWEWLKQNQGPGLKVCSMPDAGIHEMWNRGIFEALRPPDVTSVAILNNDLELGFDALTECDEVLQKLPEFAAVCPNYDGRPSPEPRRVQVVDDICANRYDGTGGLAGFAMVIAADWLRDGYRFPEDLRWWCGDNDLVLTAYAAGRKCGIVLDATVVHLDGGGQTAGDWMSPEFEEITQADIATFRAKWGGK